MGYRPTKRWTDLRRRCDVRKNTLSRRAQPEMLCRAVRPDVMVEERSHPASSGTNQCDQLHSCKSDLDLAVTARASP